MTKDIVLMDESYVKVLYDPVRFIGKVIWSGNPTENKYRAPFEKVLQYAKDGHKVTRFLSDTRNQGVVSVENRKWFEKEMFPEAVKVGLKRAAAISDSNAFKRYYINMILSSINKFGIPLKIFGDEESAIAFLMED